MMSERVIAVTLLMLLVGVYTPHAASASRDRTPSELLAYKLVQRVIPEYIAARSSAENRAVTVRQILLCTEIYVPTDPQLEADLSAWKATPFPQVPGQSWEDLPWPVWLVRRHSPKSKVFDSLSPEQVYLEFRIDAKGQVIAEVFWTSTNSIRVAFTIDGGEAVIKETLVVTTKAWD